MKLSDKEFNLIVNRYKELTEHDIDNEEFNKLSLTHEHCKLEGLTYDKEDTHLVLKHNLLPDTPKNIKDAQRLKAHYGALNYALNLAESKAILTMYDIQDLSSIILKYEGKYYRTPNGDFDSRKGHFRRIQVNYGIGERREGVDFKKLPSHINNLVDYLNENIQEVSGFIEVNKLAFEVQYKTVTIHAFGDGNSRLSRLLMNHVQHYHNQPLTVLFEKDKKKYWNALYEAQDLNDITPFQNFMFGQANKLFKARLNLKKV